jgi:hypothetical protein
MRIARVLVPGVIGLLITLPYYRSIRLRSAHASILSICDSIVSPVDLHLLKANLTQKNVRNAISTNEKGEVHGFIWSGFLFDVWICDFNLNKNMKVTSKEVKFHE